MEEVITRLGGARLLLSCLLPYPESLCKVVVVCVLCVCSPNSHWGRCSQRVLRTVLCGASAEEYCQRFALGVSRAPTCSIHLPEQTFQPF